MKIFPFLLVFVFFLQTSVPVFGADLLADGETATLRNYKLGESIPPFQLSTIDQPQPKLFTPGGGKPSVLLFFTIRPDFRKKRALALLSTLNGLSEEFKGKVNVAAVYCDNVEEQTVLQFMKGTSNQIPVYIDPLKELYNKYGIFMMPLVLITDADAKLHEVIPYTFNIKELVSGNLKLLLGEWDKKQLQESLEPQPLMAKSDEEKEYIRRINYGRIMKQKKMYEQAIREFSVAKKLLPDQIEAHLELGFTYILQKNDYDAALEHFRKALEINPDSDGAIAGLGLAFYGKGETDRALTHLENAFISPDPLLEVIIALAEIYEEKGDNKKANRLNKLAVNKLMTLYEKRWK